MSFDNHPNLASGTILTPPTPADSGTTFVMYPGDGSVFLPNMPVTLCPPETQPDRTNSEIGYLIAKSGDTLTILRHQEGTLARSVESGWKVYGTVTAKSFTDIEEAVAANAADLDTKVDQESGKGLSSNDYTDAEKTKLAGIALGATQNASDAALRDRTTHTGSQAIATVTGLQI